jgi:phosphate uptake regulator
METRKVQGTGGSSYTVTLPKEWAKAHGLRKNGLLWMAEQANGTLLLSADTPQTFEERIRVMADLYGKPEHLFRVMIGAYIAGYSEIEVYSKSKITSTVREAVSRFLSGTIGLEILEENEKTVLIRDLLNPLEMPLYKAVKRMCFLTENIHEDAIKAALSGNVKLADEICKEDNEVDRLEWLIARQYNRVSRQPSLLAKIGIAHEEALFYLLAARAIERICDHAIIIARMSGKLKGLDISATKRELADASAMSVNVFKGAISSWLKRDIKAANLVLDSVKETERMCDEIKEKGYGSNNPVSVIRIAESIRRAAAYSGGLAELVIDFLVKTESQQS